MMRIVPATDSVAMTLAASAAAAAALFPCTGISAGVSDARNGSITARSSVIGMTRCAVPEKAISPVRAPARAVSRSRTFCLARSSRDGATSRSFIDGATESAIISGALSSTKGGSSRRQVGPALSQADAARLLGTSVHAVQHDPDLLMVRQPGTGTPVYPVFQFDGHRTLAGLGELIRILSPVLGPEGIAGWCTAPRREFDGRTPAQGALGWLLARSPAFIPIPGIRTVAQAEENAGALAAGPLGAEQLAQIDAILHPVG